MQGREIKFRAYDKKHKILIPSEFVYRLSQKEDGIFAVEGEHNNQPIAIFHDDLVLEAFTGLKDKDIWGNDVMQSKDGLRKYVVKYCEVQGRWILQGTDKAWNVNEPKWDEYTKIGSIHDEEENANTNV